MLPTEWKIVAKDKSDNGLISKISKNQTILHQDIKQKQKQTTWLEKWAEDLKRYFPKETCRWPTDTWEDAHHC